ncbi:CTP synthase (glutamine hydrolyzing) [Candidatus Woesearchaeota archaeon]|nr:CTP synthase (glutamine hydrolyzing) [Candidatus Woesearchaeota archaeon]
MQPKFIIVTGGVLSGLGKGTAAASIGRLFLNGNKIMPIKCDGYLNVDPGTMNPLEHGEVFVLDDGGEVDMDFGHYERFLDVDCKSSWSITSGKIFNRVISNERKGKYLGKTIQIFPHVIDEIKEWIFELVDQEQPDIVLIEIGGTVGDIENRWFVEAVRQLKKIVGKHNTAYVHLTYIPFLDSVGELKTKPAQRDIALLHEVGITPDVVICRGKDPLTKKIKEKLALFGNIDPSNIISGHDVDTIYDLPIIYYREGLADTLSHKLRLAHQVELTKWQQLTQNIKRPSRKVTIALCGKYTDLQDSYASVIEALHHAGAHNGVGVQLKWIETTDIETGALSVQQALDGVHGILVPGGFGGRGIEGKIALVKAAREQRVPYLGICYGLQLAVVEFCRNVCGLQGAHTTEIDPSTVYPVIDLLPEQRGHVIKGATMRLGAYEAVLEEPSQVKSLYDTPIAKERHRHRYEVNPVYHDVLREHGMVLSGMSKNGRLVECIELKGHPYFIASQAHNELTSRLEKPNPLFFGFIKAASEEESLKGK